MDIWYGPDWRAMAINAVQAIPIDLGAFSGKERLFDILRLFVFIYLAISHIVQLKYIPVIARTLFFFKKTTTL